MAKVLQLRQGTTSENNSFIGKTGELSYDTQAKQLRVHDGVTAGGKILTDNSQDVTSQVVNATATIAGKVTLNDTLTSTSNSSALTAKQGKVLNDRISEAVFGIGQEWRNMTESRVAGIVYTNTTGRPIMVALATSSGGNDVKVRNEAGVWVTVGSIGATDDKESCSFIVPNGRAYMVEGNSTFWYWSELR